jgi:hypothetical protein
MMTGKRRQDKIQPMARPDTRRRDQTKERESLCGRWLAVWSREAARRRDRRCPRVRLAKAQSPSLHATLIHSVHRLRPHPLFDRCIDQRRRSTPNQMLLFCALFAMRYNKKGEPEHFGLLLHFETPDSHMVQNFKPGHTTMLSHFHNKQPTYFLPRAIISIIYEYLPHPSHHLHYLHHHHGT